VSLFNREKRNTNLDFDKMTVAISRPTNLRDKLTKAKLLAPENTDVNKLIQQSAYAPKPI
jgi:hypothetical protein